MTTKIVAVDPGLVTMGLCVLEVAARRYKVLADAAVDRWPAPGPLSRRPRREGLRVRVAGPLFEGRCEAEFGALNLLEAFRTLVRTLGEDLHGAFPVVEAVSWWHSERTKKGVGRGQTVLDQACIAGHMAERLAIATGLECRRLTANEWRKFAFQIPAGMDEQAVDGIVALYLRQLHVEPLIATANGHVCDAHGLAIGHAATGHGAAPRMYLGTDHIRREYALRKQAAAARKRTAGRVAAAKQRAQRNQAAELAAKEAANVDEG